MADLEKERGRPVVAIMLLFVLIGALVGAAVSALVAPSMMWAVSLGGAMTGGAIGAAFFLFSGESE